MATNSPTQKSQNRAFAALKLAITDLSGKEIQLTPAGEFAAVDGRPANIPGCTCKNFVMDADSAAGVIASMAKRKDATVIDFNHQTQLSEFNGQPAPAAGWYRTVEWREGEGLFAIDVKWTAQAAAMIASEQYKYISPVLSFNKATGRIANVWMAALVNNAGLEGMQEVTLAAMSAMPDFYEEIEEEDHPMKLTPEQLAELGLPATATPAEVLAKFAALQKSELDAKAALAAKPQPVQPDPAQFVPMAAFTEAMAKLSALTAGVTADKVDAVVKLAVQQGQLVGDASIAWATELGKKDLAALQSFVAAQPKIAALSGNQTGGVPPVGGGAGAGTSDEGMAYFAAIMGNKLEDVQKLRDKGAL